MPCGGSRVPFQNALWNLAGNGAGVLAAVVCIPILVRVLGPERFGVLTIVWALLAGFSLLDFVSTALTKLLADCIGSGGGRSQDIPPLFWIAFLLTIASSSALAVAFAAACPFLVWHALKIPKLLQPESLKAFYLVAAAIPAVMLGRMFRGVLAGFQRFDLVNYVRIPLSILTFLGSVIVLPFTHSLVWATAAIASAWILSSLVQLVYCIHVIPGLVRGPFVRVSLVRPLWRFGGWMTVFNLTVPVMTYLDRFIIGAIVSMSAVTWYATPHEMAIRLNLMPTAVAGVLLPAFAESLVRGGDAVERLTDWGLKYSFLMMFPAALVVETLAPDGLAIWLGPGFAQHSTVALRWLTLGIFFNAMAAVPLMLILSAHRPDIPAKVHLIEAPLYLALLCWLTYSSGVSGAAMAAALTWIVDGLSWFGFAWMLVPCGIEPLRRSLSTTVASVPVFALAVMIPDVLALKAVFLCVALTVFGVWTLRTLPLPPRLAIAVQGLFGISRQSA
jgi:O-antigen/teichoic acid export membrane protein